MRRTARLERGFTIVEILVVIAVIALLAIVLIASIHPLEQMRKSRDARLYADAKQLYSAYQNYYSTYSEYPWNHPDVNPANPLPNDSAGIFPEFGVTENSYFLVDRGELKSSFTQQQSFVKNEILISLPDGERVVVCFEPESERGRGGGMGEIRDELGRATSPDCALNYGASSACFVCIP